MTSSTRLGDLLRVIHTLRPDDEQLRMIAELLPDHDAAAASPGTRRTPARDRRRDRTGTVAGDRRARPSDPPGPRQARRKDRRSRREARRALLPEPGPRERNWWFAIGAVVLLVVALQVTGHLQFGAWPLVVVGLLAARPTWWYLRLAWSAWWHSPQQHSTIEGAVPEAEPEVDDPAAAAVTLTHVRWREPPPGPPLVQPGQQRAVATLLAGRSVPGEVDIVETIRRLASRQPLAPVPRRRRWSTNLGMQLHVDMGAALDPFRDDVEHLRAALTAIASPHGVVELGFEGDPRWITWPRRRLGEHRRIPLAEVLPPPRTPVLVLTDLGIAVTRSGSGAEPAQLLDHHRRLEQAGCDVRYLVPYPPARWPAALRGLPVLPWTDDLGAGEVLAGIRRRARAG